MNEAALSLEHFSLVVENEKKLDDITLTIKHGEVTLIYGPRNSGKSLLLRSFIHLNEELFDKVEGTGSIKFDGIPVQELPKKKLRQKISYIDTSFLYTMDNFNVIEFFRFLKGKDFSFEELTDKELDLLQLLNLQDLLQINPKVALKRFSSSEKLSLLIYSTFIRDPEVVIIDNVLDHLDDQSCTVVKNLLLDSKGDRALLISSRFSHRFMDIADLLIYLKNGKILYAGKPEKFVLMGR
ncbi:MAG: ABC transporter ATP-binding protein [Thermotogae bacterium]|uniref:ATP-binding cassette domain-containing protein n=1 Tax=Kosmotoga arenicorallina TaxID=688066 RepID=A0A7C5I1A4_9BACT|nr:ATP-binding cassette domain-containing protein [Kosmotoga sp.]MBO8166275.1 ATP-binding cassette domain-containing protein [Kosmotoga sp.]MCD6159431.1 ATP-binding cassette domain-containing protein [Kosmotoga sp.]RKX49858.1 MAG: ABC transporter ATP-binding protein [Thermotogota bacterium]HHF08890.1 ATP-binding cassette domain-containing protein [Kosmotoga arenicorallina]